jgi:metallophosphoesterase (TIGR00282 family)
MKTLFISDVVARIGRRTVQKLLPDLRTELELDLVIAQSENMTTGNGLTIKAVQELMDAGVDAFTGGNHSFKKAVFYPYFEDHSLPVLRPANYPDSRPGRGSLTLDTPYGKFLLISIEGSRYNADQSELSHPLKIADEILKKYTGEKLAGSLIDLHGDLTSEKIASGYYFDGRVSAVVGTHTHVPTADARVLSGGTAHISDVGMTGPDNTVLGVKKEIIIHRWLEDSPRRHEVPTSGPATLSAVLIDIDTKTGLAKSIERVERQTEI